MHGLRFAAILVLLVFPLLLSAQSSQDLTGVWQGEWHLGGNTALVERCIQRTSGDLYSGVDVVHWRKNGDNTPFMSPSIHPVRKPFVARFDGQTFYITEMDTVEGGGGVIGSGKATLVNVNGTKGLKNADNSNVTTMLVNPTFPSQYQKYLIDETALHVSRISYAGADGSPRIRYNDKIQVTVDVSNGVPVTLRNLSARLTAAETDNGLENAGNIRADFNLGRNASHTCEIRLTTNFTVPHDSLHFTLTIGTGDIPIVRRTFAVATEPFFQSTTTSVPAYSSPRLQAVAGYFGYGNGPWTEVPRQLEPLVAGGDKMAAMWKAVFLSMGYGGSKIDEEQGYAIGKTCLATVEGKARQGDAEAMYLMFYAFQMGLEGNSSASAAAGFLEKAAGAGFKPAVYDYALQLAWRKDYANAFQYLNRSYSIGIRKAAVLIGTMYERGLGTTNDQDSAIAWYKTGMAFGDPDAYVAYANIVAKGNGNTPPDIHKALELAATASARNCTDAMIFTGTVYFDGKQGVARNLPAAIKWYKQAAEQGDRQAMLALGEAYMAGGEGLPKDVQSGLFWVKRAAEQGSPKAMVVLAECYNEGVAGEQNIIIGRYWYNQAVQKGYARADATGLNAGRESFLDFWKYADFSPSYVYVNEYGSVVGNSDDGLMNGLFSGLAGAMMSYYGNHQQLIDGLEFIMKRSGRKIYGGTVSSHFMSNLVLRAGQTVDIHSYGIVSTGMMSGPATADGLGNAWAEYRIIRDIPCSAVMAGVKDSQWKFIGQHNLYTAPKDGQLLFALNAIDYANYKGYFDITVEVPDN